MVDGRVVRSEHRPTEEHDQEDDLSDDQSFALGSHEFFEFNSMCPRHPCRHRSDQKHDDDERNTNSRHDVQRAQDPRDVAHEEDSQRFGNAESPIGQSSQQIKGQREHRQPQSFDR